MVDRFKLAALIKVFNMESCQRYLSAGYLTLLFSVAAAYDAGRDLLADGGLWNHLTAMGSQVCSCDSPCLIQVTY